MPIILALGRLRQVDYELKAQTTWHTEFHASFVGGGFIARLCLTFKKGEEVWAGSTLSKALVLQGPELRSSELT